MPRLMDIVTPLGPDVLRFHSMHAREELGRLGSYQIELLSEKKDLDFDKLLGQNVTVKLLLPSEQTRHFNGFVTRIAQGGRYGRYYRYSATVNTWLWFLTRTTDCRIFQEMTVPKIIEKVFADHGVADFEFNLTGTYRTWTYCVQYRETDFNFISRLMEEEGIYYFFRHTEGHNTAVFVDSTSKHEVTEGYEKLKFVSPEQVVRAEMERITSWDVGREIQPGVYVHDDYDLERPSVDLMTKKALPRTYKPSDYEVYDYPGHYLQKADGENYAHVRIDEYGTQFETARAATNAMGVCVGSLFTLETNPREDQNREHLVVAARYDLQSGEHEATGSGIATEFRCSFVAMSSAQQYRARRETPKPFVQGPPTAVVVGPAGDEIYTDKYGRVKVQFHWDRYGKKDENSSCWVRVSSPWAGKGWGAVHTPRIGQEVIVDFLEGDPDQPIITGRVYNAENPPPFGFPGGAVISGTKSDTHKGGGFNEMSLDDTAGKERVFIHGQYNMDTVIEHDQTSTIHNNRTDRVDVDDVESVGNNQTWEVGVNRDATIGSNETLTVGSNRTKTIGANETISVGSNRDATIGASESLTVALQRTHTVGVNETITVGAAQEVTVGGVQAITVGAQQSTSVGGGQSISVGGSRAVKAGGSQAVTIGQGLITQVGKDEEHKVAEDRRVNIGKDDGLVVKKNLNINAGEAILIQTGDASISMKKDGTIVIKGKDITLQGSGKVNVKADGDIVLKGSKIKEN